MAIGLDQDDRDPYEGTNKTARDTAASRGEQDSYRDFMSTFGGDDANVSAASNPIQQFERPSFLERVSNKLGNIFGGIEAPKFDIQKPEFDPTGVYRRTGKQLVDMATPGVKTPLGALPSVIAATGKVANPVTTALSLANFYAGKKPEIDSFVESILGKKDKPEPMPAPMNVRQLTQNEVDALSQIPLTPEQPFSEADVINAGEFTGIETLPTRERMIDALGVPPSYTPEPAPNMQALELNPQQLAFFDTNVFGNIPNPIDVLTNKNLARQGRIYTSASSGGRGSKKSKGDLINELSRSIGDAINFSGSNR